MRTEINSIKISAKGQVTISAHARRELGLTPNTNLLEVVVNRCLVLIPQEEVLPDIFLKAKDSVGQLGMDGYQFRRSFMKPPIKKVAKRRSKSK